MGKTFCLDLVRNEEKVFICMNLISKQYAEAVVFLLKATEEVKKNFKLQAAFLGYVNDNTKDKYIFSKESISFQHNETVWKWINKYRVEKSVFFSPFRCEIFQSHKTSTLENNNDCYFFWKKIVFFSEFLEWLFSQKVRRDWFSQLFPLFKYTSVNIHLRVLQISS